MPYGPRLDWTGAVHHVMSRGIDGRRIFTETSECIDFLERLGKVVRELNLNIYAWVLMPNHFHLLVETGEVPLSKCMQGILTGFAMRYNLVHERKGHVFQGRYRSILVEVSSYFQTLISYIHLNPLKAGLVNSLDELKTYPWSGHIALLGGTKRNWQNTQRVYSELGADTALGPVYYQDLIRDGTDISCSESALETGNYVLGRKGLHKP